MKSFKKIRALCYSLLLIASTSHILYAKEKTSIQGSLSQPTTPSETVQQVKININTASVQEIANTLVGIGEQKARAIVEYREQHGPFISIDQLSDVKGIGKATIERNRSLINL